MMRLKPFFLLLLMMPLCIHAAESIDLQQARQMAIEHNRNLQMDALDRQRASLHTNSSFSNYLPRFYAEAGYRRRNKAWQFFDGDKFLPVVPWQGIDPQTGNFNPTVLTNPGAGTKHPCA